MTWFFQTSEAAIAAVDQGLDAVIAGSIYLSTKRDKKREKR